LSETQVKRLYLASRIALVATAMTFAVRGDILGTLGDQFTLDNSNLGWIAGAAFWGFALSIIVGGALVDAFGLRRMLMMAFALHVIGIVVTIVAGGFLTLFIGTLLIGLGNGAVEAAVNPLVASAYPDRKAAKLNGLHVWFPGGIVIGAVAAYLLTQVGAGWQVKMAIILVPTLIYGAMFVRAQIPPTERVLAGISTSAMFRETLRPMFLLLAFGMLLTAATELGTNQWLPDILTTTAGVSGILVLAYINGLMAVGRSFAGPILHRISPMTLLLACAAISAVGLLMLSFATSAVPVFAAATIFAVGITFFWPTMLGVTSERFPAGGALLLGLMGGIGNLSVATVLPIMGGIYDANGAAAALRWTVVLPVVLLLVFGFIWFRDRSKGGYRSESIGGREPARGMSARPTA